MVNRAAKPFVVFWLAAFTGNPARRGYTTELVHPRFKDYETMAAAEKLYAKLVLLEENGGEYQSRQPSCVTRSWT